MEKSLDEVALFLSRLQYNTQPIVLVTSGGTRVPLEKNMVRFLDNFSGGDRGATSAEYFLARGYAVIFMHRTGSKVPLSRGFCRAVSDRVDSKLIRKLVCRDELEQASLHIAPIAHEILLQEAHLARKGVSQGHLLIVDFVTVYDYLFLLEKLAQLLSPFGPRVCLFLAAAVSDFYIPEDQMATHKIQSGDGNLKLELQQVPKLLGQVTSNWCPHAFIVSFKLETDSALLQSKAEAALKKYKVHLVVANMLQTRKDVVYLVTMPRDNSFFGMNTNDKSASSCMEEIKRPIEARHIEARLIEQISLRHLSFLTSEYQTFHDLSHPVGSLSPAVGNTLPQAEESAKMSPIQAVAMLRREFAELAPSRQYPQQMRQYLTQLDAQWDALTRPAMTRARTLTQTEEEEERDYSKLIFNYGRLLLWTSTMMALGTAISAARCKR